MLDIKQILSDQEVVASKLLSRGIDFDLDEISKMDAYRRSLISELEGLKRERNEISKQVGLLKRDNKDTYELQEQVRTSAGKISDLDKSLSDVEGKINMIMLSLPNLIDDSVPFGEDENSNTIYKKVGEPRKFNFDPKPHWDLGVSLGILDFERGAKISRSRFTILKGDGARLERALINFMMDLHSSRGYVEVLPPYLINTASMTGTGQLPKFQEEAFWCERDDLYLSPTAEVPVTNMYSNEIIDENKLPLKYTAYSACFRREAGSYGKDVRGLIRQHQFDKVELVHFCKPEDSMNSLEDMLLEAEEVLKKLELPYQVITLCSGDIGFAASKTYDIEVWIPTQNCYREISSCSNCKDFQARRANIRYRKKENDNQKVSLLHTLNGSGLAVGRTLVAILENFQQQDGSVIVPKVLRPYIGGQEVIKPC